jgi:hypothetical protein
MPLPNIGPCGYNFLKHRGRFSFITCFAGHTIRWLSSNFISFIHVIKMKLTSESDIWKRHAKSCTKSPNLKPRMFSYVSPCYGGRASEKFIFNNCAFVSWLEPNDQVMADRGFKVKEDLMVVQSRLAIPAVQQIANRTTYNYNIATHRQTGYWNFILQETKYI